MGNFKLYGFAVAVLPLLVAAPTSALVGDYEEVVYYHNDALGSPVLATDGNGDVLWREQYTPYGSRLLYQSREVDCGAGSCMPVESSWDEKQWFTGKLEESRTGLQHFGARWYEPELGRFLSPDPVLFKEDNIYSFNRYAYANNNPYKYLDPDGREVAQVGVSAVLPEIFGDLQNILERDIKVSGYSFGVAWSYPDSRGQGEYDIGLYLTTHLNGEGVDTGRFAVSYSESVDEGASLKDIPGIGGGAAVSFGFGGFDLSYSEKGLQTMGIHLGYGAGVSARGEATAVISSKHGKIGWNNSSVGAGTAAKPEKQQDR
jgi:RHS repeat-associated protein